jgi:GT2 family glycosyltransferase
MLKLPGQVTVAWAVFDAQWYQKTYPDVSALTDAGEVLQFYVERGQRRGDSPNIWFDEQWHIANYPDAARMVREGGALSGFDAYCRGGFRSRSPHWLFNEARYRRRYPDLRDEVLTTDSNANGYDHYLKHGSKEGRIGHPLFDPVIYRFQLDDTERAEAETIGPFTHYLRHIAARGSERRTSVYFDPIRYLHRYPLVAEAIEKGLWLCALQHYLCNDTPTTFDPLPEFAEADYLARYPDIAEAVETKVRRNGYDHFLIDGASELRAPIKWIDLHYYVNAHPSVRADLDAGTVRDAFVHYLTIGRAQGLSPSPPPEERVTEQQARALFRRRADDLMPTAGHLVLDFTCHDTPAISVIMVVRDEFPQMLRALGALRANYPGELQLILVQTGRPDQDILNHVRGARILYFESDVGLVRAYNTGLHCVTGVAVLFLSAETELVPGAVAMALQRLQSDQRIGMVGCKLIRGHGRLDSAGGIIWRDGVTQNYLRDSPSTAPEANFVRDVDFCSSAFLLARADLLHELEGFDDQISPSDLAAADLCVRVAAAEHRVVYDPAVMVYHFGTPTAGPVADVLADRALQYFVRKHMNHLRFRYIADRRVEVFARSTGSAKHVLFIDDMIPMRSIGSGFVRSTDIIGAMASIGYGVTVFPINQNRFDLARIYASMPDSVEVMYDRGIDSLGTFLAARQGYYDAIWIARTHNLDRVRLLLDRLTTGSGRPPRIILDTEAIASLRDAARATLLDEQPFNVDAAIRSEFANAHACQNIVAVNAVEAQKLRDLGFADVAVIGHALEPRPTPRNFDARAGLLFIGAIHQMDSPNYDGLVWFVREVLPLVEQSLGWETRLVVAGYVGSGVSLEQFSHHPRITLRGSIADAEKLYDAHRIFIAPTRFAAGTPYKVHEAASFGIPVVATELLRNQLGWESGRDLLSAEASDAAGFARQIVTLYRDARLWSVLRDNALERISLENSRAAYEDAIRHVLEG